MEKEGGSAEKSLSDIGDGAERSQRKASGAFGKMADSLRSLRAEASKGADFTVRAELDDSAYQTEMAALRRSTADADDTVHVDVDVDTTTATAQLAAYQAQAVASTAATEGFIGSIKGAASTLRASGLLSIVGLVAVAIAGAAAVASPAAAGIAALGTAAASAGSGIGLLTGVATTLAYDLEHLKKRTGGYGETLRSLKADALAFRDAFLEAFRPAAREAAEFGIKLMRIGEKLLPMLGQEAKENVGALRRAFEDLKSQFGATERGSFMALLESSSEMLGSLARSGGRFGMAILNAASEAMPVVRRLRDFISELSRDALAFTRRNPDAIKDWFSSAVPLASELWRLTSNVLEGLIAFGEEHAGKVVGALKGLNEIVEGFKDAFDLEAPKPKGWKEAGEVAGESFSAAYRNKLLNEADNQKGENSASYELGYNIGKSLRTGALAGFFEGDGGLNWSGIGKAIYDRTIFGFMEQVRSGKGMGGFVGGLLDSMFGEGTRQKVTSFFKTLFHGPLDEAWDSIPWRRIFDFKNARQHLREAAENIIPGDFFGNILPRIQGAIQWARDLHRGIGQNLNRLAEWLYDWRGRVVDRIVAPFKWAYDRLVGNSIVPEMVGAVVRIFGKLPGRLMGVLRQMPSQLVNFWKNRIWQPMANFVVQKREGILDTLANLKQGAVSWVQGLIGSFLAPWKSRIWQPVANFVVQKKTGILNTLENLKSGMLSLLESLPSPVRKILEAVGDAMVAPVAAARDSLASIFNSIVEGIATVLENVGMSGLAGDLRGAKFGSGGSSDKGGNVGMNPGGGGTAGPVRGARGGIYRRSGRHTGMIPMASGGIHRQDATGGFADGSAPHAVYGEAKKPESYTVWGRKDNLPFAEGYLRSVGYTAVPRRHRRERDPEALAYMSRGGTLRAWRRAGVPFAARGRIDNTGAGAGIYGPTANYLWDEATRRRAEMIIARFPVSVNTYKNHPPGYPQYAQSSIDSWALAGRGSPIGYPSPHNEVLNFIRSSLSSGLKWTLGEGDAGHSGSQRHVHATWAPQGKVGSGGAGLGGVVQSLWNTVGSALWDRLVQPFVDRFVDDMQGGHVLRQASGGMLEQAAADIKEMIISRSGSSSAGSGYSGDSPKGLTLGEVVGQTWPENERRTAVGVAWEESTARADAQNPSGARGLFQIMPGTAKAFGADYSKLYDPIYNSQAAARIQNGQGWGAWVAYPPSGASMNRGNARVTGYSEGGIANRPQAAVFGEGRYAEAVVPLVDHKIASFVRGVGGLHGPDIGALRDEIRGLRQDMTEAGIRVRDFDAPAAQKMGHAAREGGKAYVDSSEGTAKIHRNLENRAGVRNLTGSRR